MKHYGNVSIALLYIKDTRTIMHNSFPEHVGGVVMHDCNPFPMIFRLYNEHAQYIIDK